MRMLSLCWLSSVFLLAGCAQSGHHGWPHHLAGLNNTPAPRGVAVARLRAAEEASDGSADLLRLQAASALVRQDTYAMAMALLRATPNPENQPTLQRWRSLVNAQMALFHDQPYQAWRHALHAPTSEVPNDTWSVQQHQLLFRAALAMRAWRPALRQRDWLVAQAGDADALDRLFWQALLRSPMTKLSGNDPTMRGWFTLARWVRAPDLSPAERWSALQRWANEHPDHPAVTWLSLPASAPSSPEDVAVLLPMHGPLASAGLAVREGLLAAWFADKHHHDERRLHFIDTSDVDWSTLPDQLRAQSVHTVIGPLAQDHVDTWARHADGFTTFALNHTSYQPPSDHFFQLSLSPVNAVPQVVERALNDGHHTAWVIHDDSAWGQALATAFNEAWQQRGGELVPPLVITSAHDANHAIAASLGIDASKTRYRQIKGWVGSSLRFHPHRVHDRDMIFLATNPERARLVAPMLAYNFAGDLPIYSTFSMFSEQRSGMRDHDLEGIRMCDAPWVTATLTHGDNLEGLNALQRQLRAVWPHAYSQRVRLYALAIDAYHLLDRWPVLTWLPGEVEGATGRLHLVNGWVRPTLSWFTFYRGHPKRHRTPPTLPPVT